MAGLTNYLRIRSSLDLSQFVSVKPIWVTCLIPIVGPENNYSIMLLFWHNLEHTIFSPGDGFSTWRSAPETRVPSEAPTECYLSLQPVPAHHKCKCVCMYIYIPVYTWSRGQRCKWAVFLVMKVSWWWRFPAGAAAALSSHLITTLLSYRHLPPRKLPETVTLSNWTEG